MDDGIGARIYRDVLCHRQRGNLPTPQHAELGLVSPLGVLLSGGENIVRAERDNRQSVAEENTLLKQYVKDHL